MSQRPTSRPYGEYLQQQRHFLATKKNDPKFGPKLYKQMVAGFVFAGLLGLVLMILGASFIHKAIKSDFAFTVMLCVFGMVAGLIIFVGTIILAKLLISRKWLKPQPHSQHSECFHTCSVVYTPSQDQITVPDAPPSYEAIMLNEYGPVAFPTESPVGMALPPKYKDVAALPNYCDQN